MGKCATVSVLRMDDAQRRELSGREAGEAKRIMGTRGEKAAELIIGPPAKWNDRIKDHDKYPDIFPNIEVRTVTDPTHHLIVRKLDFPKALNRPWVLMVCCAPPIVGDRFGFAGWLWGRDIKEIGYYHAGSEEHEVDASYWATRDMLHDLDELRDYLDQYYDRPAHAAKR
jgi:hypothetical protein